MRPVVDDCLNESNDGTEESRVAVSKRPTTSEVIRSTAFMLPSSTPLSRHVVFHARFSLRGAPKL